MKLYKICNKISLLLHALCSAAGYFLIEAISRHSFTDAWTYMTGKPLVFAYNAGLIFTTSLIVYLFRRRTFWRVLVSIFWLLLGIINGVILANRVTPFTGPDLHLLTDGMAVLNKYLPSWGVVVALIVLGVLVLILLSLLIKGPKYQRKVKFRYDLLLVVVGIAAFVGITQLALEKRVLSNYFGNIAFAYEDYGYPYCLGVTIFNTGISCPRDYSEEEIERIEKTEDNLPATNEKNQPNILFLQLESFFDPTLVNYLKISEDPIPTFRKLMKEYSSGYYKVPAVGAGTANTEFESITGMSLHYFGPGEYPYKISTQGHGAYPEEQLIDDPEITVTGAASEAQNNQWEYYCNEIHEMDNFVKELTDALADYPEDVILVMYGDHLPTMGLTVEDLKNKYLFQTEYVMWDNFGMEKKKVNLSAYQMAAEVMDRAGIHEGTIFRYHQARRNTRNYQVDLETLQYDLLYGEKYAYKDKELTFERTKMRMGIYDVSLDSMDLISDIDFTYRLKGTNFTPSSQVKLNGEWIDTVYVNPTTLMISGTELKDFDRISVSQRSNSSTRKALSKSYDRSVYMLYSENKWKLPTDES